jgi:hypothetical protein
MTPETPAYLKRAFNTRKEARLYGAADRDAFDQQLLDELKAIHSTLRRIEKEVKQSADA